MTNTAEAKKLTNSFFSFYEQAKQERVKAKKLQVLIKKLNERDKKRKLEEK